VLLTSLLCLPLAGIAQAQTDDQWDDSFYLIGLDGDVRAIVQDGSDLYVGGEFRYADGIEVNHVAHWDGTQWHALGEGMDDTVLTLLADDNCTLDPDDFLLAGGYFLTADGQSVNHVAAWDGVQWEPIGTGLNGTCYVLESQLLGGDPLASTILFAGGFFTEAGGESVCNIANYSIGGWGSCLGGVDGSVLALLGKSDDHPGQPLIVAGEFTMAFPQECFGGDPSEWMFIGSPVGYFFGHLQASQWIDMEPFVGGSRALAGMDGLLYAPAYNRVILAWDISGNIDTLGSTIKDVVWDLETDESRQRVYAGGLIDEAGGNAAENIAYFDENSGTDWEVPTDGGTDGPVYAMTSNYSDGGNHYDVVVGGDFHSAGGMTSGHLAGWDETNGWTPLFTSWPPGMGIGTSSDFEYFVFALSPFGAKVVAGGFFYHAGQYEVSNIAQWDGTQWLPMGSGILGFVKALCANGNNLFVGGAIAEAGGMSIEGVAVWDGLGSVWIDPSPGSTIRGGNDCLALVNWGGTMVAGASVYVDQLVGGIGGTWQPLGGDLGGGVYALISYGGTLIAGGSFGLSKWDGANWTDYNGGISGTVYALTQAATGELIVGGYFTSAGGTPVSNVAMWDPVAGSWSSLDGGFDQYQSVRSLTTSGGKVYAGGDSLIASWDAGAGSWTTLGSGIDGVGSSKMVFALCDDATVTSGSAVFAGGIFSSAGGKPSWRVARWIEVNTMTGTMVTVPCDAGVDVTFDQVDVAGFTSAVMTASCADPEANFQMVPSDICYDISTTAAYSAQVEVCIEYDPAQIPSPYTEYDLVIKHEVGGNWDPPISQTPDYPNNIICAKFNSLSPFALMVPAPDCSCPYQSDFDEDGFLTSLDLTSMIDILFVGATDVQDAYCPSPRADYDCDGFSTAADLAGLIDHLFTSGPGPCDPCTE
jgi:hypothetical protein